MASKMKMWQQVVVIFVVLVCVQAGMKQVPIVLNEETWVDILEGEWLVKL